jgi:hypothetical protein
MTSEKHNDCDRNPKRPKRQLAVLAVVASLIIGVSTFWLVSTARHHGSGRIIVGGDEPGTGGAISSDEKDIWVSEAQYKRDNYFFGGLGLVIGVMLWRSVILDYREKFGRHGEDVLKRWQK